MFIDHYYLARISGLDPYAASSYFSDARLLLILVSVLVAAHVALPIRCCLVIVHEACGPLVYLVCGFVLGSPEGATNVTGNLLLLIFLTICMAFGKRQIEHHERTMFQNLIAEKTLRFDTEFQLARMQDQMTLQAPRKVARSIASDEKLSLPETTSTGQVFGRASEDELEGVIEIGRREQWLIDHTELELSDKVLGRGSFGIVVEASYLGIPVATKLSLGGRKSEGQLCSLVNEARILRKLRHPNIVCFYGLCFPELALVLELVEGTALDNFIQNETLMALEKRLGILKDISCALLYLHSREPTVIHGDIKDKNIFVQFGTKRLSAKLLDFGLSQVLTQHAKPLGGTFRWIAPEIVARRKCKPDPTSDVFSFGRIMFLVLTGAQPLISYGQAQIVELFERGHQPELLWPVERPDIGEYEALVQACTQWDPLLRPSMNSIHRDLSSATCIPIHKPNAEPHDDLTHSRLPPRGFLHDAQHDCIEVDHSGLDDEPLSSSTTLHSQYEPTPLQTVAQMILTDLMACNFTVSSGFCCPEHLAADSLMKIYQKLRNTACHTVQWVKPGGQCVDCKALVHDDTSQRLSSVRLCDYCGGDIYFTAPIQKKTCSL